MLMKGEDRIAKDPRISRDALSISYGCINRLANMPGPTCEQFQSGAALKLASHSFLMQSGFEQDYSRFNSKPDVITFVACDDGRDAHEGSKPTVDEDK
jgi:hypothetical protein